MAWVDVEETKEKKGQWVDIEGQPEKKEAGFGTDLFSPEKDLLKTASNLPGNLFDTVVGIGKGIMGLPDLAKGIAKGDITGSQMWDAFKGNLTEKYGGTENIHKSLTERPAEVLMDLSALLGGGGALLKGAGAVTKSSALSGAGKTASEISKAVDPLNAVVQTVVKPVASKIGEGVAGALGTSTGTGTEAVKTAYKGGKGLRQGLSGTVSEEDILGQLGKNLDKMREARNTEYATGVQNLKALSDTVDVNPIKKVLEDRLEAFGVAKKVKLPKEYEGLSQASLAKNPEIMESIQKQAKTVYDASKVRGSTDLAKTVKAVSKKIDEWDDFTPYGMDTLRMQLRQMADTSNSGFITPVINSIRNEIEKVAPGYRKMLGEYEKTTNKLGELKKTLSIPEAGKSKDTAIRKLETIFRDVNKHRLGKVEELDPTGELKKLAAGAALRPGMPRGYLSRFLTGSGIGYTALLHSNPGLATMIAAMASPRLVGEGANLLGKGVRGAGKAYPHDLNYILYQLGQMEGQ